MKALTAIAVVMSCLVSNAYAADENKPTKEQIELTNKILGKDNLNNQPKPAAVQCWYSDQNKWYNEGSDVCYHNNMWRCGHSGQWYALGRTC